MSKKRKRKFTEEIETSELPERDIKQPRVSTCTPVTSDYFAIDCEMTQIRRKREDPSEQVLASVAIVDSSMKLVYDAICPPPGWNTDLRKSNLVIPMSRPFCPVTDKQWQKAALEGVTFESIQEKVKCILEGKNIVGHAVQNDLSVLGLNIPSESIYDIQCHYTPKRCSDLGLGNEGMPLNGPKFSLKTLAKFVLGSSIQNGPHDAKEDAMTTMALYLHDRSNFKATGMSKQAPTTSAQRERRKRRRRKSAMKRFLKSGIISVSRNK